MKKVTLTFGRLNPPTIGHEKLINKVVDLARANQSTPLVYLSHTQNAKKDPLSYADKTKYARKAFGRIVTSSSARTIIEVMQELQQKGFTDVILVVGSDRIQEFKTLLNKYNGKDFTFDSIKVVSAGARDPDAEGVEGMSASKLRELARAGNEKEFMKGIPSKLSAADGQRLYKTLRKGMMVEEIDLEAFVETLDIESIELDEDDEIDEVLTLTQRLKKSRIMKRLAPRFKRLRQVKAKRLAPPERLQQRARKQALSLIRKRAAGEMGAHYGDLSPAAKITVDRLIQKKLPLVSKLAQRLLPKVRKAELERLKRARTPQAEATEVPQDQDVKDRKGTQPAKYFKDLSPSTKAARDAHFKKGKEKESDDPSAYKPAPGDKSAETKPSTHTKKFKQMYGEQNFNGQNYDGGGDDLVPNKMRVSMISGQKKAKNVSLNGAFEKIAQQEQNTFLQRTKERHQSARQALSKKHSMEKDRMKRSQETEIDRAQIRDIRSESLDEKFAQHATSSIAPRDNYTLESKGAEGLKKKADKTGIPYSILKKVYDRGVAAWRTGHRPGTTPQQWGFARVNSFATGGKTRTTADADLWKQVKKEDVRVGPYFGKAGVTEEIQGKQLAYNGKVTKNFDICPSALKAFNDNMKQGMGDKEGFDSAVQAVDKYLGIEKRLIDKGSADARDMMTMKAAVSNAKSKISSAELPGHDYHQIHIDAVKELLNEGNGLWYNIHKKRREGRPMREPGSKGAPTKQDFKSASEDFKLTRLGSNPGKFKRLVTKHLGAKAAEKIGASDGERIMAKAKRTDNKNLFRQGSFIKNFYGKTNEEVNEQKVDKHEQSGVVVIDGYVINDSGKEGRSTYGRYTVKDPDYKPDPKEKGMGSRFKKPSALSFSTMAELKKWLKTQPKKPAADIERIHKKYADREAMYNEEVNLDEAFTLAMATPAGMGSILTAADMGIKLQGGFAHHPSVNEVGGAGEYGTTKLAKKYKEDTPGQNEAICELSDDDEYYGFTEEEFEVTGDEQYEDGWEENIMEAEYQGRKVTLGKPFLTPDGPKKRSVYVTNDKGNVVKVNFGDPNMKIKKSDPDRRRSFRARHNCENPGPRWKARYWSCKAW